MEIVENIDIYSETDLEEIATLQSGDFKKMDSASDSQVSILKILLKEKYSFGCAIKMWFDWQSADFQQAKEIIDAEKLKLLETKKNLGKGVLPFRLRSETEKMIKTMQKELQNYGAIYDMAYKNFYRPDKYQSLTYEKCVYDFITRHIILKKISPNFIPLLGYITCNLSAIVVNLTHLPHIESEKINNYADILAVFPDLKVNLMITGSSAMNGGSLDKFSDILPLLNDELEGKPNSVEKRKNTEEFKSILFQCIYSLAVMEYFGIVHNDFHFRNIFIHTLTESVKLKFIMPGGKFSLINTKYIVKFFDWDRAYVQPLNDNPLLYRFLATHQINKARTKQDFYQLLCGLSKYPNLWKITQQNLVFKGQTVPYLYDVAFLGKRSRKNDIVDFSHSYLKGEPPTQRVSFDVDFLGEALKNFINNNIDKGNVIFDKDQIFIEIQKDEFEKMFVSDEDKVYLGQIIQIIGDKRYDLADRLYFEVVLYRYSFIPISLSGRGIRGTISSARIITAVGHGCQSLYDTSDDKIPRPLQLILDPIFTKKFTFVGSSRAEYFFSYTFPTEPLNSLIEDEKPCAL
jgi:hypothetical protein